MIYLGQLHPKRMIPQGEAYHDGYPGFAILRHGDGMGYHPGGDHHRTETGLHRPGDELLYLDHRHILTEKGVIYRSAKIPQRIQDIDLLLSSDT
jgi:hypothetical protein